MPIHSNSDTDAGDLRRSGWASAGVTSSLAAAAAALLREDPARELSPRLQRALGSMKERFVEIQRFASEDFEDLLRKRPEFRADPDRLIAQIAVGDQVDTQKIEHLNEEIQRLISDIDVLLEHPTSDVAESVEMFLGVLSDAESARALTGSGEVSDSEFSLHANPAA